MGLLTAAALIFGGCSKSVEGESKRWEANTAQVSVLAASYPGFKAAIEARKAAASKIHDAAAGLEGDAKIEKLSEANRALMQGFVGDLEDLEGRMKKLRESRVEAASKASDDSARLGAKVAADDAQRALDRVEEALKNAGAADEASASAILKKLKGDLDTAQAAVDKVLAVDKAKQDDAAAKQKSEASKKEGDEAAAKAAVAPWKCGYCDSENPHDETSCKSCGAPKDGKAGAAGKDAKAPAPGE